MGLAKSCWAKEKESGSYVPDPGVKDDRGAWHDSRHART